MNIFLNEKIINFEEHENVWIGKALDNIKIKIKLEEKQFEILESKFADKQETEKVLELFTEAYFNNQAEKIESEQNGVEFEENEISDTEQEKQPYDPESIRVDTKIFSIKYIHELLNPEENEAVKINLTPDFQRNFVWTDITRKSRLIESILLRIPLPVFYFSQDIEGNFSIIDGVQRLTVINDYLNNKFVLKNLEYLKECEGKCFKKIKNGKVDENLSLDNKYRNRMHQTQITCNVIDPQTPSSVKFDIFRRINTGGKNLNPQEMRNCLAKPEVRNLLNSLKKSSAFLKATDNSIKATRLDDQEIVLRFISFYCEKKGKLLQYKGNMNKYLDDALEFLNENIKDTQFFEKVKENFIEAMQIAEYGYGKYAFRKIKYSDYKKNGKRSLINKSLFIAISINLSDFKFIELSSKYPKDFLLKPTLNEIESNIQFYDALTNGTNDYQRLNLSIKTISDILIKLEENTDD